MELHIRVLSRNKLAEFTSVTLWNFSSYGSLLLFLPVVLFSCVCSVFFAGSFSGTLQAHQPGSHFPYLWFTSEKRLMGDFPCQRMEVPWWYEWVWSNVSWEKLGAAVGWGQMDVDGAAVLWESLTMDQPVKGHFHRRIEDLFLTHPEPAHLLFFQKTKVKLSVDSYFRVMLEKVITNSNKKYQNIRAWWSQGTVLVSHLSHAHNTLLPVFLVYLF